MTGASAAQGAAPGFVSLKTQGRIVISLLCLALATGFTLRVVALSQAPPGFNQDEACNGYDAYCLLETGRDHHGNRLPLVIQGFNDYRMALFDYSLIPLIAFFGLKPWVVRLGAALWGCADLAGIALLGWMLFDLRAAVVAVILAALCPWHLALSRFGIEATSAAATVTLAVAAFIFGIRSGRGRWVLLSGLLFGLSLYSYSITKVSTPLMVAWLALRYWRELRLLARPALGALLIVGLCGLPQAFLIFRHSASMQARFNQTSVFRQGLSQGELAKRIVSGYASQFGPSFLFENGDWYHVLHPPMYGELLPVEMVMILLGFAGLIDPHRRRNAILLLGWLAVAGVPGALVTPAPHALHDVTAMAPWALFAAMGFVCLAEIKYLAPAARLAASAALLLIAVGEGMRFVNFYFGSYPALAARDFQYGVAQAVQAANQEAAHGEPIVITPAINQPYIYALFFGPYPPALFQRGPVFQSKQLFAPVYGFGRYAFVDPAYAFARLQHGIFVFGGMEATPIAPFLTIHFPDGGVAYKLCRK